jgi:hypothetical protein
LAHLDLTDAGDVATARSSLLLLRAVAPLAVRHDLTQVLDGIDDLAPHTLGGSATGGRDELDAAARRIQRYLRDTCGIGR